MGVSKSKFHLLYRLIYVCVLFEVLMCDHTRAQNTKKESSKDRTTRELNIVNLMRVTYTVIYSNSQTSVPY